MCGGTGEVNRGECMGEAKVGDGEVSGEDVGRFEVAVDDPPGMHSADQGDLGG